MKNVTSSVCLWFTLAALPVAHAEPPAATGILAPVLQPFVDRQDIAGAVVLIADGERVLDIESVGYSSLDAKTPMRTDNLFWLASITKVFTSTAVTMLIDEGKLNVDDPVEKYLPEFQGQMAFDKDGKLRPPSHPITIRELLTHTSGIVGPNDPPVKRTHNLTIDAKQYAAAPLKWEPGTKFEYNNSGIDTAGRIIEVVSGMPYAEFIRRRLIDPLGMTDASFWPNEEQVGRLAKSSMWNEDKTVFGDLNMKIDQGRLAKAPPGPKVPLRLLTEQGSDFIFMYAERNAWPAGGLFSTAADLAKLGQMALNGGTLDGKRYLSAAAVKTMTTHQSPLPATGQATRGLGWFVLTGGDEGPSVGSFGHRGARGPVIWVDPTNGLVMILLFESFDIHRLGDPPGSEQKKLCAAFFQAAIRNYGKSARRTSQTE